MGNTTFATSKKWTIDLKDFLKGLLVAVISSPITIITTSLDAGSLTFDWKKIAIVAVSSGLAYIVKNWLTPAQVVITDPSNSAVEAVNKGEAKAVVQTK